MPITFLGAPRKYTGTWAGHFVGTSRCKNPSSDIIFNPMTVWSFISRLPKWSVRETLKRAGFEWGKFAFIGSAAGLAVWFMVGAGQQQRAVENVGDWLYFTLPALLIMFGLFVLWTATTATYHYIRSPSTFRFELLEKSNFVEMFNNSLGEVGHDRLREIAGPRWETCDW